MKSSLDKLSKEYLTEMYINKKYDSASKIWDKGMLIEMQNYYAKSGQGNFSDLVLADKMKIDVEKYFKNLTKFQVDKILDTQIENAKDIVIGYVFFEYQETIKSKSEKIKTMLTFISSDNGKTWSVQDWKIKDIADKVNRRLY
ncbi:hypothetical protein [Flavobacterium undicola]|uniref:hypothetical protein n=1 Tax=Flavobacterium undicola TaxID=1932779 RepID=UPI0015E2518F|nr:hypothetical protein [Flavobacterium undicola]MBA0882200.1 hypothetical protein [Flavobacterium undicola]